MNDLIAKKVLGREPSDTEQITVVDEYANTSSAGSIIAFHKHKEDFDAGDLGVICSFGRAIPPAASLCAVWMTVADKRQNKIAPTLKARRTAPSTSAPPLSALMAHVSMSVAEDDTETKPAVCRLAHLC